MNIEPNKLNDIELLNKEKLNEKLNKNIELENYEPTKKYIKTSLSSIVSIVSLIPELPKKNKLKCAECNTKLNITNNVICNCGKILCYTHRYHNTHKCNYDFKAIEREQLAKQNQKIVHDKITKI